MSRVGKKPIEIPQGVNLEVSEKKVVVKGPKGELSLNLKPGVVVEVEDNLIKVKIKNPKNKAMHGTTRAILANMVKGVLEGWEKELEVVGTGYRCEARDNALILTVGFSHPVEIKAPENNEFKTEKNKITVSGIDKEEVGKIADIIRKVRPPEPYKGKGIRYKDEEVRRKPGKAAKAAAA